MSSPLCPDPHRRPLSNSPALHRPLVSTWIWLVAAHRPVICQFARMSKSQTIVNYGHKVWMGKNKCRGPATLRIPSGMEGEKAGWNRSEYNKIPSYLTVDFTRVCWTSALAGGQTNCPTALEITGAGWAKILTVFNTFLVQFGSQSCKCPFHCCLTGCFPLVTTTCTQVPLAKHFFFLVEVTNYILYPHLCMFTSMRGENHDINLNLCREASQPFPSRAWWWKPHNCLKNQKHIFWIVGGKCLVTFLGWVTFQVLFLMFIRSERCGGGAWGGYWSGWEGGSRGRAVECMYTRQAWFFGGRNWQKGQMWCHESPAHTNMCRQPK